VSIIKLTTVHLPNKRKMENIWREPALESDWSAKQCAPRRHLMCYIVKWKKENIWRERDGSTTQCVPRRPMCYIHSQRKRKIFGADALKHGWTQCAPRRLVGYLVVR
jgi:hypothetical protein